MKYIPMTEEQFVEEEEWSDARYHFYRPTIPIQIFRSVIDIQDMDECAIGISTKYNLQQMLPVMNAYWEWMTTCKAEMTSYFQERLGEMLPEDWFENIEVYGYSFIFDDFDDYGATIIFGESVLSNHTIEFDFEKHRIVGDRLNG